MKSHDLFDLIHSLTPAEKGYFKKFISLHGKGEKKYVKLFDAINAQKEHNEEAIKKKLGKQISNLSMAKGHLFDMLLQAMHVFQGEKDFHTKVHRLIEDGVLLNCRQLPEIAAERFEAAYRLAEGSMEAFYAAYAWFMWQNAFIISSNLADRLIDISDYENQRDKLICEIKGAGDEFTRKHFSMAHEMQKGVARTQAQSEAFRQKGEVYYDRLLQNTGSRIAQYQYNYSKAIAEYNKGNYVKAFILAVECAKTLRDNPLYKLYNIEHGLYVYSNIMICLRAVQGYDQFETAIAKLRKEMERYKNEINFPVYAQLQVNIASTRMRAYINDHPELAKSSVEELRQWIANPRHIMQTRPLHSAYQNLISYYLSKGDRPKMMALCNDYLYSKIKFSAADRASVHTLLILQLIEDGDSERLRAQIKHARKKTENNDKANEVLFLVCDFAGEVLRKKNTDNIKPELEKLKKEYNQLKINKTFAPVIFFNLSTWIESRLLNITYVKLTRQNREEVFAKTRAALEAELKELNLTWNDLKLPEWYLKE